MTNRDRSDVAIEGFDCASVPKATRRAVPANCAVDNCQRGVGVANEPNSATAEPGVVSGNCAVFNQNVVFKIRLNCNPTTAEVGGGVAIDRNSTKRCVCIDVSRAGIRNPHSGTRPKRRFSTAPGNSNILENDSDVRGDQVEHSIDGIGIDRRRVGSGTPDRQAVQDVQVARCSRIFIVTGDA